MSEKLGLANGHLDSFLRRVSFRLGQVHSEFVCVGLIHLAWFSNDLGGEHQVDSKLS